MTIDISSSFDNASLEDLEQLARVISMEAGSLPTFTIDPKQRFGQFFSRAGQYFKRLQIPLLNGIKLMSGDMNTVVGAMGFVDASNKQVIVPEGFVGQWLPYSGILKDTMGKATKADFMVRSFNDTLGRLINDNELLKSASGIGHNGPTTLGLDDAMREIGKVYFDGKSNHITRTLGAVVERAAEIPLVHNNVNDAIALDKANPAKKALASIERTMELAGRLTPTIDSGNGISKVALQELIDITLQIAREMEAYGVLLFRIRQFSEALKDSVKELKK